MPIKKQVGKVVRSRKPLTIAEINKKYNALVKKYWLGKKRPTMYFSKTLKKWFKIDKSILNDATLYQMKNKKIKMK